MFMFGLGSYVNSTFLLITLITTIGAIIYEVFFDNDIGLFS